MKKMFAVALMTIFGLVAKAQAASVTKSISSTTFSGGLAASDPLLVQPRESFNYSLTGGATGTIHLEQSVDGQNYTVIFSSVNNSATGSRTGTEFAGERQTWFRFRASTMTGAGTFVVTLTDNDDFVAELRNNKKIPIIQFWDDTIRFLNNKGIIWNDVIPSTATDSRSVGGAVTVYLTGSTAALEGSVLVATTPVAGQGASVIVAPATNALGSVVGIASEAKAVSNQIVMYTSGLVLGLTTGTVVPGDMLGTADYSAGYLKVVLASNTVVGVAMANGTAAGGKTKIKLR